MPPAHLDRANLDFLLGELRVWRADRRIPDAEADALLREYAERRAALDAPVPMVAAAARAAAPAPATAAPAARPAGGLPAFLEANHIAALHLVGSLVLMAGLLALVRWQWGTPLGKGIVLGLLLLATVGLSLGGRILSRQHSASGLALSALGTLIAPLNAVAANLFRVFGEMLPWDEVGVVTAAICAALILHTLRRTRHPLFAVFLIVAVSCGALFAARLLVPGHAHLTYAAAFLPASALFFAVAHRLTRTKEARLGLPFLGAGNVLALLTVLRTLTNWPSLWARGPQATALVAVVIAALYGAVALAFRLPALVVVAAGALVAAGQLLLPEHAALYDRAVFAAFAALLLYISARLHRRETSDATVLSIASGYEWTARIVAIVAVLPFGALLTGGHLALRPATGMRLLTEALATLLMAFAPFIHTAKRRGDARVHLLVVALGSLALFSGVTLPALSGPRRALLAAGAGAALALVGGILAALRPSLRRVLRRDAAILAGVATLPLLPFLLSPAEPLGMAGVCCLLSLAWAFASVGRRASGLLYPAAAAGVFALRLAAGPLADWGTRRLAWEPNETRWLLAAVPGMLLLGRSKGARPLLHAALAAALWVGIGQVGLVFGDDGRIIASPALTLWLLAAGFAVTGGITQRPRLVEASLVSMSLGYLAFLLAGGGAARGDATLLWTGVAGLTLFGAYCLWIAWEQGRPLLARAGGLSLFAASAHALSAVLPAASRPAWALWLLPCFFLLFALGQIARGDPEDEAALRRPLHGLTRALSASVLALFLLDLARWDASPWGARDGLLGTTLAYAAFYVGAAFLRGDVLWLRTGIVVATAGALLRIGGYPRWETPLAPCGFWLTVLAGGWLAGAALLAAARRWEFAEALTNAGLAVAAAGATLALAGVASEHQGRWTVYTLIVAGTTYAVIGKLRQSAPTVHAAFAAWFGALALFLYDALGPSLPTAEFTLIPVGLYLIVSGCLVARARPDDTGRAAAQRLYAAGLFLALTPTFLASCQDRASFHSFLLVAECVGAVYFGILRRIRVFPGVGVGFLIALLGVTSYDPLRQVHWGIYLTLFGAAIVGSAVFFEKRRNDVLRWAQTARAAFEGWE